MYYPPGQFYAILGLLLISPINVHAKTTLNVTITKETTVDIPTTLGGGYMWEVRSFTSLHIPLLGPHHTF